jgi:hypothetical protein
VRLATLPCLLLSLGVSFAAAPLRAEPTSPSDGDADPGRVARARALFDEGVRAYAAGRYYDAIDRFTETARIYPNQQLSFNIAKAYDNLGHRSAALCFYREYLRSSSDPPDAAKVTARVEELERALAERGVQQLTVLSEPSGATVVLDGEPVGLSPWTGESWPGRHRVELKREGYVTAEQVVELDAHRAAELELTLEPAAKRPASPPVATATPATVPGVRVVTWAALAVATTTLGTAVVIEVADDREARGIAPASAFFAGIGAAAAATGGVLLYFDLAASSPGERGLSIGAAPGGALASYRTTF